MPSGPSTHCMSWPALSWRSTMYWSCCTGCLPGSPGASDDIRYGCPQRERGIELRRYAFMGMILIQSLLSPFLSSSKSACGSKSGAARPGPQKSVARLPFPAHQTPLRIIQWLNPLTQSPSPTKPSRRRYRLVDYRPGRRGWHWFLLRSEVRAKPDRC